MEQKGRTSVLVSIQKDVTIDYLDKSGRFVECRILNFMSRNIWTIAIYTTESNGKMDAYSLTPTVLQEEFVILSEIVIITELKNSIIIEYPFHSQLRIIDIPIKRK